MEDLRIQRIREMMQLIRDEFEGYEDFINNSSDKEEQLNKLCIIYLQNLEFNPDSAMAFKVVIEEDFFIYIDDVEDLLNKLFQVKNAMEEEEDSNESENNYSYGEEGYVYILMNPSMEGLVKIGKTTRDPETRMDELSKATGVPTPFSLIYKEYFSDCSKAEHIIHEILEQKGFRVSSNREFFEVPIYEAVKLVQNVKNNFNEDDTISPSNSYYPKSNRSDAEQLAKDLYEEAGEYYDGLGDKLQDYEKAMTLYKKASKLGSVRATYNIGNMYLYGEGCKQNLKKAIEYFQKAAALGHIDAYSTMANIFGSDMYEHMTNTTNAIKCWNNYFEKNNFDDNDLSIMRRIEGSKLADYVDFCFRNELSLEYMDILSQYKDEMINAIEEKKKIARERDLRIWTNKLEALESYIHNNIHGSIEV